VKENEIVYILEDNFMIDIKSWATVNNYKVAWGNVQCLSDSYDEFERMSKLGELHGVQEFVFNKWGSFNKVEEPEMKTVILIAAPTGGDTRKIIFNCDGREVETLLPPWYSDNASKNLDISIEKSLSDFIGSYGYKAQKLSGPYKDLSARLGLGKYGRNNLMYVEGFGSYIRLIGFVTNAEFESQFYPEIKSDKLTLENCEKCVACKNSCPTNAIGDDRFRLHVDRCLSDYSESTDEWPDFVKTAKNRCLVGCLNCQQACSYNKNLTDASIVLHVAFTREETDYILGKLVENKDEVRMAIEEKLGEVGLTTHKEYVVRNLRSLINNIYSLQ
jgi:epoxyqueuosine reductase